MRTLKRLAHSAVLQTTASNFVSLALVAVLGIVLARALGEAGRGHYAAITAWYGVALTIGELGQYAALNYYIARNPKSLMSNVRRARTVMLTASSLVLVGAFVAAGPLSGNDPSVTGPYRLMFLGLPITALFAPFLSSFQTFRISTWNILRIVQPFANLAAVLTWMLFARITLTGAVVCLLASTVVQLTAAAYAFTRAHQERLNEAPPDDLLVFGLRQAGTTVPGILSTNMDRLVLSQTVSAAQLGQYAVAQSVVAVATPLANSIASVVFPRFAARDAYDRRTRDEIRTIVTAVSGAVPMILLLVAVSPWLIPFAYGEEYSQAVQFVIWVAPAVAAKGVVTVMSALLRGRGRPGSASIAHTIALLGAAVVMMVAVPQLGVVGAAVGSFAGNSLGIAVLAFMLFFGNGGEGGRQECLKARP